MPQVHDILQGHDDGIPQVHDSLNRGKMVDEPSKACDSRVSSPRLTSRQVSIVRMIADAAPKPVTINAISEKLGVSSRTVLREMPTIERWFKANCLDLVRKPGVGVCIQESQESSHLHDLLRKLLASERMSGDFSRQERRRQILGELLSSNEPIKSFVFQSRFNISEGTLSADLDSLESWLNSHEIQLVRRPGVGLLLESSELARRQAIANAALEFMDEGEILSLLRNPHTSLRDSNNSDALDANDAPSELLQDRLFNSIDPQIIAFVEDILAETEKKLDIKYTDSGYMALVVHMSLSIQRLMSGEIIEMDPKNLEELDQLREHEVAEEISRRISERFDLEVPREETGFITMHLSSARIWPKSHAAKGQIQSINAHQIVMALVDSVEHEIGLPFHTCTRMIEELTSHMDAMISRLTLNIRLDNDQIDSIRTNYPDIYAATERACSLFRNLLQIKDISPSEITFVAMHFVAAAETLKVERKKVAVVVVCPSGMGASRMLAANLMRTFHNIEIRQIVSAFNLDPERLHENGIDLVVSTVPLQLNFPNVCVSPIPQTQDITVITKAVESINARRQAQTEHQAQNAREQGAQTQETQAQNTKAQVKSLSPARTLEPKGIEWLRSLTRTGEEIAQILDHFVIRELSGLEQTEDLLGHAAALFADGILTRQHIAQDLAHREALSSTYLPELDIYLLHCRTKAISHCRFGYLRLAHNILAGSEPVEGAVLLLAPDTNTNEGIEVISRLSMLLAENNVFLQALQAGDEKTSKSLAEEALVRYYRSELTRIGDERL